MLDDGGAALRLRPPTLTSEGLDRIPPLPDLTEHIQLRRETPTHNRQSMQSTHSTLYATIISSDSSW